MTTAPIQPAKTNLFSNISLARGVIIFTVVMTVLISGIVGVSAYRNAKTEIGSPNYSQIVEGKDLIADILPPPAFAIEAYVLVLETAKFPQRAKTAFEKFRGHKEEFFKRIDYWKTADIPDDIRSLIVSDAVDALEVFWSEAESAFFPTLVADPGAVFVSDSVDQSVLKIDASFSKHKKIIEQAVTESVSYLERVEKHSAATSSLTSWTNNLIILLSAVIFAGMIFVFMRHVVRPMSSIAAYTSDLAAGKSVGEVPFTNRGDEIGSVANALTKFRDSAQETLEAQQNINAERERAAQVTQEANEERERVSAQTAVAVEQIGNSLKQMASGDFTCSIDSPFDNDLDKLRVDLNSAISQVAAAFGKIANTTESLGTGVREIVTASDDLSVRTEKQAASLEETAATLSDITATVVKSSEGAENTQSIVEAAKQDAQKSGVVVEKALAAMVEIENSAKEINQIISVIDEIAFQTNLLALNAGVEAARAGDAGQGFAVVASEVRALAQRSAVAAKEIKDLISKSSEQVADGSDLVGKTGETLHRIAEQVLEISTVVDDIADGAKTQSRSLNELNTTVGEMDAGTQQNAAMAEEATAACHSLRAEADELISLVGQFKVAPGASVAREPAPKQAPVAATKDTQPAPSPAKSLVSKVTSAFTGNAALKDDDWSEF